MRKDRFVTALLFAVAALTFVSAATYNRYGALDKRHFLTEEQIAFVRPGLNLDVQEIEVTDARQVRVTFTVADDRGLPLDLDGVRTPGPIRARFVLAYLPSGQDHYEAYTTRVQTSPITGDSAVQPTADSGGSFERIGEGTYVYTFGVQLPEGFEADATHSVGIYSDRDLSEFNLGTQIDNDVEHFLPAGGEVPRIRDIARNEDCNACHDPLAIHGGFRQKVELCVMCHYDGVVDPDTGNSVDMGIMTHRIHMGMDLPSVQAGEPYQIIGFRQTVFDYSTVEFPQDIRYCESCHSPEATQNMAHLLNPTRASCGSCHDDVDFETGEGHVGGPAISDNLCSSCHLPEGELEFDASIRGAHTIPANSRQLAGINIEIEDVMNTGPGENPTVIFRVTDDEGQIQAPSDFSFFNLVMAGPTNDYKYLFSERVVESAEPFGDSFSYTFNAAIPSGAMGTFVMGAEAFRNVPLNEGTTQEFSHRETAENPVFFFPVTSSQAFARRRIVTDEKCEACHKNLNLHGSIRHNATDYCQTCHNPVADDSPFRTEGEPRSIDFKMMIHRIHRGEELTRDYTLIGFMGSVHNYNEVRYPGDLRNCEACHVGDSYTLPTLGIRSTIDNNEFFSPIAPETTSCLGCHDGRESAAHAFVNIAPFGEACAACHGEGAEFAVSKVHAR